jgi:hypothetical protein
MQRADVAELRKREDIMEHGIKVGRRDLLRRCIALAALTSSAIAAPGKSLKIGLIGAGRIGGQLAKLWADAGYQVMISARNLDEV